MAIMIPAHPEFAEKSYEDLIFDALKKLPDDCKIVSIAKEYSSL